MAKSSPEKLAEALRANLRRRKQQAPRKPVRIGAETGCPAPEKAPAKLGLGLPFPSLSLGFGPG